MIMENRITISNRKLTSPNNSLKQTATPHQYRSPKFFRRRNDIKAEVSITRGKNSDIKKNNSQVICYISPKKIAQCQSFASGSSQSIASLSTIKSCVQDSFKRLSAIQQNGWQKHQTQKSQLNQVSGKTIKKIDINSKSLGEQNIQLKEVCMNLETKLSQQVDKNKRITEQNQYLYSKLQEFNMIFGNKNKQISDLNFKINLNQQEINTLKMALKDQRQNVSNLQSIIETINKNTFQASFRSICENFSQSTEDDTQEQQLHFYRNRLIQLTQLLKYAQIHQAINHKLRSQIKEQKDLNKSLRCSNKKLQAKIKSLHNQLQLKNKFYPPKHSKNNQREDLQISLELSPQK